MRKTRAIKKNWTEKDPRWTFFGKNPHSKGEFFLNPWAPLYETNKATNSNKTAIPSLTINKNLKYIINPRFSCGR